MGDKTIESDIDFDLNDIDDNKYHTTDFTGRNFAELTIKEWFEFAKANKEFKEPGISTAELAALHTAIERTLGRRPITIVETGMCYGVTTRYFVVRNIKYGGTHTSFEVKVRDAFKKSMEDLGLWHRVTRRGHSMKDSYEGDIDLLWIDSEHALEDALGEYMRFRPWLKGEALIGFHDTDCCPGVRQAIEMIQEVDKLELITESSKVYGAGCQLFQIKDRSRGDRPWNTRERD